MKSVALLIAAASFAIATTRTNAQTTTPPAARLRRASSSRLRRSHLIGRRMRGRSTEVGSTGRADIIRALGENDLNSSAAAINWEAATSRNRKLGLSVSHQESNPR